MKYIFGPVLSRRLGLSLGVDLLPEKVCTFDCIFCECGRTKIKTTDIKEWVPAEEVIKELKEYLKNNNSIDFVTITGSGEPTLHSRIGYIIEEIKKITLIPVAVLTNSSILYLKKVREAISKADVILPSLNAVSEKAFRTINRQFHSLSPTIIIEGLIELRKEYKGKIWVEIVFVKGINDSEEEVLKLKETLEKIKPDKIHLNTVARPPAENWAKPLTFEELERIQKILGEPAEIVAGRKSAKGSSEKEELERKIEEMAKRRPLSREEISQVFGMKWNEISEIIESLIEKRKLKKEIFSGEEFFISR
ncbi:MAG: radical SAM protein [Candidatus Aminicenantia bacterium]